MKKLHEFFSFKHLEVEIDPSGRQKTLSKRWALAGRLIGIAGLGLLGIYWLTDWLPVWFGYVLGPTGLAAWCCLIQSQDVLRSAKR